MITVAELWTRLDALATSIPTERIPLAVAHDRILHEVP